ncbi:transmembrane protein 214 [Thalassophryne amazonica]|uniref:transmembrane protein 214 n=1 Tax=Thalassophryne amazonica TaxID=390379 RepID=UPI0014715EAA|nr:transmembrane protein 214 [Thalassophryne amazonica]XP_034017637.1 transmembrane protein 214 [Thalassophryne amazonica]
MASNNGSVGKWEVVKKGKKSNSGGGKNAADKKSGGGGRKALGESNQSYRPPIKTSETLFEAFEKIGNKQNKEQVPPPAEPSNKKPASNKPSKKSQSSSTQSSTSHKNLEEAFKALDVGDLKQQLARSQTLFPENPSVWVKDLAGYLNFHLAAPETEPTLSSYAHDYPYCLTGKELRGVMKGLFGRCTDILPDFFDHCVYSMLKVLDRQSGEQLHGYRVCIQAVLQDRPKLATQNLAEYLEILRSVQNRPAKCLTIMWALGQAGFYDLSQGLRVWLGIMLPVLGMKSLSSYAIAYLGKLLLLHTNLTKGFGIMGPKEFFPLLDFAFMPKNALSQSLQEQLRCLYPRLKVLAFGAKPESTLHTYLPSFLSRATPNCPGNMKKELLSSMTECLCVDIQSLGVWRQLYTKHLPQSSLLLSHLLTCWNTLPPKLRKNLEETVQSFRVTNEEMKYTSQSRDLQECNKLCHNLQVKMRGRGFPWSKLLMVLLVFVAGFVVHDIKSHGSFTDSTTSSYLENSGITTVSQQAWGKIRVYSKQGFSWLETNTPHYYSECVRVLRPVMEQGLEKTKTAVVLVGENANQLILWVKEKTPLAIEWVINNTPDGVLAALKYLKELLIFLYQNYILPALMYLSELLRKMWTDLQDSCNGEVSISCLQRHALSLTNSTWQLLQHTTSVITTWAHELLTQA